MPAAAGRRAGPPAGFGVEEILGAVPVFPAQHAAAAAAERRCGEEAAGGDGRDASTPGGEFCGLAFVCAANLPQSQRCARLSAICRHPAAVEDRLHDAERGAAAS